MVKTNLKNKKIIKALTIGLSLAMASQPITAYAAEDDSQVPVPETEQDFKNLQDNGIADAAQNTADTAWVEVKEAEVEATEAIAAVPADAAAPVANAADALKEAMKYEAAANATSQAELVNSPDVDVRYAAGTLEVAEDFNTSAIGNATEANKKAAETKTGAETIANLQKDANDAVDEADKVVKASKATVEEAETELKNADTVADANSAYDKADTAVKEANDAISKADTKLGEIKEDFDDAVTKYNKAASDYDAAKGAFEGDETGFANYIGAADREASEADTELTKLADKAGDLAGAAADQVAYQEGLEYVNKVEQSIINRLNNGGKVDYVNKGVDENKDLTDAQIEKACQSDLFNAVVKYYYVPSVGGEFVSMNWVRQNSGTYTYDDGKTTSSLSDVLNYCEVTYKDANGELQTVKLNYKIQNSSNNQITSRWSGIVIFEKTEHIRENGKDAVGYEYSSDAENLVTKDGANYVKSADNSFYQVGDEEGTTALVNEVSEGDETVSFGSEETVSYEYADGKIYKTVSRDVTTTRFTGASLGGETAETTSTTEKKAVSKTAYNALSTGLTAEYRNDNWYTGNIILMTNHDGTDGEMDYKTDGKDKSVWDKSSNTYKLANGSEQENNYNAYKAALAGASAEKAKYAEIQAQAEEAQAAFEKADQDVKTLINQIKEINFTDSTIDAADKSALNASLQDAINKLEETKKVRNELVATLKTMETTRNNKVAALTPSGYTGGGETTDAGAADTVTGGAGVIIETGGGPAAATPGGGGGGAGGGAALNQGGAAGGNVIEGAGQVVETAGDETTEFTQGPAILAAGLDEKADTTAIDNGDSPLAATPINEEAIGWWWLLLIAVFGATGYSMYKKHQEKKAERADK